MAQGRVPVFGGSLSNGSEEIYDFICCPCDKNKIFSQASSYCAHCDVLYCGKCLQNSHVNKPRHKVVNVSDWGQNEMKKCGFCTGQASESTKFCEEHGVLCCDRCANRHHSDCSGMKHLTKLSVSTWEIQEVKAELPDTLEDMCDLLKGAILVQKEMESQKKCSLQSLHSFKDKIDQIFLKLEANAKEEIKRCYFDTNNSLQERIRKYDEALAELRLHRMIIESNVLNEYQKVILMHRTRQLLTTCEELREERPWPSEYKYNSLKFEGSQTLLRHLESIESFESTLSEPENTLNVETSTETRDEDSSTNSVDEAVTLASEVLEQAIEHAKHRATTPLSLDDLLEKVRKRITGDADEEPPTSNKGKLPAWLEKSSVRTGNTGVGPEVEHTTSNFVGGVPGRKRGGDIRTLQNSSYSTASGHSRSDETREPTRRRSLSGEREQTEKITELSRSLTFYRDLTYLTENKKTIARHDINVKIKGDENQCNIQGMFGLTSGTILLTDSKNKRMKQIDKNFEIIDFCDLPAAPRGVCNVLVEGIELAVTALANKTIQFVELKPKMKPQKTIQLNHDCFGISSYKREIFVTEKNGKYVYIYDLQGSFLRTVSSKNLSGISNFSKVQHLYITRDGARLYVADVERGLVTVQTRGNLLCSLYQPELKHPCGVCTDRHGNVYVSGYRSHNVVKYSQRGTEASGPVVSFEDGVRYPICIWFDSDSSRLLVSDNTEPFGSDTIKVYDIDRSTW